jgi:hypothetical protein
MVTPFFYRGIKAGLGEGEMGSTIGFYAILKEQFFHKTGRL